MFDSKSRCYSELSMCIPERTKASYNNQQGANSEIRCQWRKNPYFKECEYEP